MSENDKEEKILAYLLGECSGEKAFEVEKLCREDSNWQAEKIRLGQVIGLVEDSLTEEGVTGPAEKDCQLSPTQRAEIKALLEKKPVEGQKSNESSSDMAEQTTTNHSKYIFWAPLAAAAVAAFITYWGSPEKEKSTSGQTAAHVTEEQKDPAIFSEANFSDPNLAQANRPSVLAKDTDIALQAAISESANETLALRTASEIQKLEKTAIDQLPDGKELMKRIQESNATAVPAENARLLGMKKQSASALADAFTQPTESLKRGDSQLPTFQMPKPKQADIEAMDRYLPPALSQISESKVSENEVSWDSVLQAPESSYIFNEDGDSLGKILLKDESSNEKVIFQRANWPNKNRSFKLEEGVYEIRLAKKIWGTLILRGTVEPIENGKDYQYSIDQAWELGPEEKRISIPLKGLNP
ncbi:MAG TPA: hypothetical protein DCF87_06915 [Opitutae bacterium]|nr:hypothetical protein [Opitutae bacterium]